MQRSRGVLPLASLWLTSAPPCISANTSFFVRASCSLDGYQAITARRGWGYVVYICACVEGSLSRTHVTRPKYTAEMVRGSAVICSVPHTWQSVAVPGRRVRMSVSLCLIAGSGHKPQAEEEHSEGPQVGGSLHQAAGEGTCRGGREARGRWENSRGI